MFRWTYTDDILSGVELLDEYFDDLDEILHSPEANDARSAPPSVVLNKRMYLIWKFPDYFTSYVRND